MTGSKTQEVLLPIRVPQSFQSKHSFEVFFVVTILHRLRADSTGQARQDLLRGREEATEKDDPKKLQNHHLQKIPLLARETSEGTVREKTLRSDLSVFMRKEVKKGIPPLLFIRIKGDCSSPEQQDLLHVHTHGQAPRVG